MGSDSAVMSPVSRFSRFQSTLPGWGATRSSPAASRISKHFNPRSPDGERPGQVPQPAESRSISIHAPRMGSDVTWCRSVPDLLYISIHAPRMGSDVSPVNAAPRLFYFNPRSPDGERRVAADMVQAECQFQSTLPGWGATPMISTRVLPRTNFNPRSPDGERLCSPDLLQCLFDISIHAPRMGSDLSNDCKNSFTPLFQSTLPGWGATKRSDDMTQKILFQSTLPGWGATFSKSTRRKTMTKFQSTLPGWGATRDTPKSGRLPYNFNPRSPDGERLGNADMASHHITYFNPRSPDGERPTYGYPSELIPKNFNPRSPDGERHGDTAHAHAETVISIHAPRMGSDFTFAITVITQHSISIHAPRMGSDHDFRHRHPQVKNISIHAPRMGSDGDFPGRTQFPYGFQSTLPGWGATAKMDIFAHDMGKIIHFQH